MPKAGAAVILPDGNPASSLLPAHAASAASGATLVPDYLFATAALAATSGRAVFTYIDLGPGSTAITALHMQISGAMTAGTGSATMFVGLYSDDGTGSKPNLTGGPIVSGSDAVLASTVRTMAVSATLKPGRYWLCTLYYAPSAPTTAPTFIGASTVRTAYPQATFNAAPKYAFINGVSYTALPTTNPAASAWAYGVDNAGVVIGLVT